MSHTQPETEELDRGAQIRRVVDAVLTRRAAGEHVTDEAVCEQHGPLLPELAAELRKLKIIGRGREQSQQDDSAPGNPVTQETAAFVSESSRPRRLSRSLHIRCPLCHEPLEIATDQSLDDVQCSACRGRFSLAGDDPELKDQQPVTRIAHFELVQRLGMGGFGTVWKAIDTKLDRAVALKIPRRGQLNSGQVEEFLYEARVAARLRHPNIVVVHEIGRDGDNVYIVSDLVEGASLDKYKAETRLTHREAAELMATICDALHFAHQAGIVHRDLKPGNILMDASGQPHITDFGLAKRSREEVEINLEGEILGTPAYMSPEQARGESHLADSRTDVYALGVILFELLTDELPFRGNVMMLTHHAVHTEPPSPRRLNATVSHDLETICLKCLEKSPARRYASAQELGDELRRFLAGDPILARPISRSERLWRWCRKNPRIPALSAALLAVVLMAYAFAWQWMESRIRAADRDLSTGALTSVEFAARSIAATAGQNFEKYLVLAEQAARDPALINALETASAGLSADPQYAPLLGAADSTTDLAKLREDLKKDPRRHPLRDWTSARPLSGDLPIFAWFVLLPDGLQIARQPEDGDSGKTIGENYSWRTYFHGGESDYEPDWRAAAGQAITGTFLSSPFLTKGTQEYVVAVSTPVYRDPAERKHFMGIVGLMISLGTIPGVPGNSQPADPSALTESSFAIIVDSRPGHEGQVLQHPLYTNATVRQQLLDAPQHRRRVRSGNWTVDRNFRDPFGKIYPYYSQPWLAGQVPVLVHNKDSKLRVIAQESYDQIIGKPLGDLRRGLVLLSLMTLALSAAVIVPLWTLILRLVR